MSNALIQPKHGDLKPLKSLVEGDEVDEFVRSTALRTFAPLYKSGQIGLDTIREYFTSLYRGGLSGIPFLLSFFTGFSDGWHNKAARSYSQLPDLFHLQSQSVSTFAWGNSAQCMSVGFWLLFGDRISPLQE